MQESNKKKAKLLIVDDEPAIITELEILLCRAYEVYAFTDPERVETFLADSEIDVIICDEMMPGMRGSELLSRVHRTHPDICKIVLSGHAEKNDVVKAINEGRIFSFLFKPVNRQQLLNVIEKGLENRRLKLLLEQQNAELKELNENLEQKVNERTEQLITAHNKLAQVDENKMAFLIYLSYEMTSSLDRIKRLAHEVFTYFGIAGCDLKPQSQPFSYKEEIDKILLGQKLLIAKKKISLTNQVTDTAMAKADPKYRQHILATLLNNAIIFCNEGGVVTITTEQGAGKTRLLVSDSGKGFLQEDAEAIFRAFVIPPKKRNPDGFGLNLPLARILVDAHEGLLTAISPGIDQGATFILEL